MTRMFCLLPVLAIVGVVSPVGAQSIRGRVMDRGSGNGIAAAVVHAVTASGRSVGEALADSAGEFTLALRGAGSYRLRAGRIGYPRVTSPAFDVAPVEELRVDLYLSMGAVELDPLTITSREEKPRLPALERAGFYNRERTSPGIFMRREQVERNRDTRLSDVLGSLPGARRVSVQGKTGIVFGRTGLGGRLCTPAVFVDGNPVTRPELIDDVVQLASVEAMEVYRGTSQTPPPFSRGETGCGVIVIWTRERVS